VETQEPKHILVAANPHVREIISTALQFSDLVLTFSDSVQEAKLLLNQWHFDLIFCTIQFDSSRMFDLLRYVKKENPQTKAIPFLALKISEGLLPDSLVDLSLKTAKLIGANETVNLAVLRRELGDEEAFVRLRDIMERLL
jgi:CheY-like chemotaxis protein